MTDQDILVQLRNSELSASEEALKIVYNKCFNVCEQMILKNNGTKEDAKDIYHDALVIFYNKAKDSEFILKSKISTFLYGVSRNLWYEKLREAKKFVDVDEEYILGLEGGIEVPDKKAQSEGAELLANLLQESGQKCLTLLKMFYYEKMRMKEISEVLGFASDQVAKNQKSRCIKKLRAILRDTDIYKGLLEA